MGGFADALVTKTPTTAPPDFSSALVQKGTTSSAAQPPSGRTVRVMQQSMGGPPQFVDVPEEQAQQFEQAGQRGYQTGAKIGSAMVGAPEAVAAPLATATSVAGGYLTGKAAKYGAGAFGWDEDTQGVAEDIGNVLGGFAGALTPTAVRSLATSIGRRMFRFNPESGAAELTDLGKSVLHPTTIPETVARKTMMPPEVQSSVQAAAGEANAAKLESQMTAVESARQKELAQWERLKNIDAQSRMARGRQQTALDLVEQKQLGKTVVPENGPSPAPLSPFPGASATNAPLSSIAQVPKMEGLPQGTSTPFGKPQFVSKFTPPENAAPSTIRPSTQPIAGEGRPATWTNEVVRERAAWGDPDAIEQANLRGFGRIPLKYSTSDVNPRSVTKFDAQGNPVGQPDYAYRVRDVGESGVPAGNSHAHATTTLDEAQSYVAGREEVQGKPQEIVQYDLSKMKEGVDYRRVSRPGQPDWIQMLRPLKEADVKVVGAQ